MRPSFVLFLKRLYGDHFNREFARADLQQENFKRKPCQHLEILLSLSKIYQKKNYHVYSNVYDYNHDNPFPFKKPFPNWVYPYENNVILDRIFFDFDKDLTDKAKNEYDNLLSYSSKQDFYKRLIEQGQAKEPVTEAKILCKYIKDNYGGDPTLVFSGAKGCHVYVHFKPVILKNPKGTILRFVNLLETKLKLKALDPSVKGELSRISRIPTSKHPKTGLYSHPWKIDYSYNEIIENAQCEIIPFDELNIPTARSNISDLLYQIDSNIEHNKERQKYKNILRQLNRKPTLKPKNSIKIEFPEDILKLNQFSCFLGLPYTHESRLILANICLWSGLSPEDTVNALRIFAEDKGYYDPNKHLHNIKQIKALKKYLFTCKSMKNHNLCKYSSDKNEFCKKWFYRKLDLPPNFYKLIEGYKNDKN